jgi:hypothetical protein
MPTLMRLPLCASAASSLPKAARRAPLRLREVSRAVNDSSAAMLGGGAPLVALPICNRASLPSKAYTDTAWWGSSFSTKPAAALAAWVRAPGVDAPLISTSNSAWCAAARLRSSKVSWV